MIFSLLDALLLKPLPVKQPEQLVVMGTETPSQPGRGSSPFSYPVFRELRDKNSVFSGMFARSGLQMSMSGDGQTERVQGEEVSGNFFSVLGVSAALGRLLTEEDDRTPGAHPVAVISFNYWQRLLGRRGLFVQYYLGRKSGRCSATRPRLAAQTPTGRRRRGSDRGGAL